MDPFGGEKERPGAREEDWTLPTPSQGQRLSKEDENEQVRLDYTFPAKQDLVAGSQTNHSRAAGNTLNPIHTVPTQSIPPDSQIESEKTNAVSPYTSVESEDPTSNTTGEEHDRARTIYEGGLDPLSKAHGAIALGEAGPGGDRLRSTYMSLFDFSGLNILLALRDVCSRLALKGETQQVDRVLAAFSQRWCDSNPQHGFKSPGKCHFHLRALKPHI